MRRLLFAWCWPPQPVPRRPPRTSSARCCAWHSPAPRPAWTRRASSTCTRASLTAHIFEALYTYDHLARPAKSSPLTAAGMPEHSADFRVWTVHIRPGIYFADDPAFKGKKRELVAEDYVYALKRIVDPKNKSPVAAGVLEHQVRRPGSAARGCAQEQQAVRLRQADRRLEGARSLHDPRTRWKSHGRRFIDNLAASDLFGGVAREVVEYYGDQIDAHPVGTGPFRLKSWRRSSEIVLERNPDYRERVLRRRAGGRRQRGPGDPGALQGPAPPDGRRGARRDHRAEPADVAVVPQRRGRRVGHQCGARAAGLPGGWRCPAASWRRTWPSAASAACAT